MMADITWHEKSTRNMATGGTTAHAAVILIDATRGVLTQSRRHTCIASLLGIQHVVAAVNKMDLVEYREDVFAEIAKEFQQLAAQLAIPSIYVLPLSARKCDHVVDAR